MPDNLRETIKEDIQEHGFWGFVKSSLITGLLVAGPAVATWWLLTSVIFWVDDVLKSVLPEALHLKIANIPGLGLLGGGILLVVVGALARNYVGTLVTDWFDALMERLPVAGGVYNAMKTIFNAVTGKGNKGFSEVVMVRFPHHDSWALGLLTGVAEGEVQHKTKAKVLNVFVPTTPNPTSGFLLFVPEKDIIRLDMSVDDGLKMIMSGGIVVPRGKKN